MMVKEWIRLLLYGFSSPDDETAFRRAHHNPFEARRIIFAGVLVFCLYLLLDFFLFPEYFSRIVLIRIGIFLPVSLVLFHLTYRSFYYRISTLLFIGIAASSASGIIFIEYIVRDSAYAELYFYGISQVLIVFYGTGKVDFLPSLLCGIMIIIPAIIVDTVFIETDIHRIVTKSSFMFTMFFLGVVVSSIIQHTARDSFLNHKRVEELSMTDPLTGLKNRLFYNTVIAAEILNYINVPVLNRNDLRGRISDNIENDCYGFIMLDIDFFKKVNDNYGHEAGDKVLQEFSNRILQIIRADDVLIRWGGEEFLLLIRHTQKMYIKQLIGRIREQFGRPFLIEGKTELISVSGGIYVIYPNSDIDSSNTDGLFELADKALYYSKNNGRDCFTEAVSGGVGPAGNITFATVLGPAASDLSSKTKLKS